MFVEERRDKGSKSGIWWGNKIHHFLTKERDKVWNKWEEMHEEKQRKDKQ